MTITVNCPCGADLTLEDPILTDAIDLMKHFTELHGCDPQRAAARLDRFSRPLGDEVRYIP